MADAESETCCWPDCEASPSDLVELPLCDRHIVRVAGAASRVRPTLERGRTQPMTREATPRPAQGWVYVVRFSDRAKIGFSKAPVRRMTEMPFDEVLAVVAGFARDERAVHKRFAHLRDQGEWFVCTEELKTWAVEAHERGTFE